MRVPTRVTMPLTASERGDETTRMARLDGRQQAVALLEALFQAVERLLQREEQPLQLAGLWDRRRRRRSVVSMLIQVDTASGEGK